MAATYLSNNSLFTNTIYMLFAAVDLAVQLIMCWILHDIANGRLISSMTAKVLKNEAKAFREQLKADSSSSDDDSSQHDDAITRISFGIIIKRDTQSIASKG